MRPSSVADLLPAERRWHCVSQGRYEFNDSVPSGIRDELLHRNAVWSQIDAHAAHAELAD
jgi:hypothetical protein